MSHSLAERLQGSASGGAIATFEQFISAKREVSPLQDLSFETVVAPCVALPDTGIVIVNWNSWPETIETLEAVFRMQDFDGPVVVCDNASGDGSLAYIRQWAEGKLCALPESRDPEIRALVIPPVEKDFQLVSLSCAEVESRALSPDIITSRLWLVNCVDNRGFGAGSNVGIKLLQRMPNIQNFWLLNCDALPARRAYRELKNEMPVLRQPMICGSVLMEYWKPSTVQSCGAKYNPLLCSISDNLKGLQGKKLQEMENTHRVDYPVGASIVVNREFLDSIGFMCEDYFLYFEELDWVMRLGWPSQAFVVTSSRVYHKGGATTGAGRGYRNRPLAADYYFLRSRVLFATRFSRLGKLVAVGVSSISLMKRATLVDRSVIRNTLKALKDGFRLAAELRKVRLPGSVSGGPE